MLSTISSGNSLYDIGGGFLFSFLLALIATPFVQKVALKANCVSFPKQDRWHTKPTPLLGGIALFIAFLIPYLLLFRGKSFFWMLFLGNSLSFAFGLLDDLLRVRPSTKLIGQIVIACLTIGLGLKFASAISPLVSIPLTIFWIVGMMNALNLLDNMDGLAGGIAAISALALCGDSLLNGQTDIALLMGLLIGGTLAFLTYNFSPAKIFMGDCGSMFLGYLLSVGAILKANGSVSNLLLTLAVPVLVLSVPIFDTTFVTLMRKLNRRPISQGGRDHPSHRLVAFGLSERKAVLTLYGVSLLFGMLSFLYSKLNPAIMVVLMGLAVLALFSFGMFLGEIKVYTDEDKRRANGEKNGFVFLDGILLHKRRIVEVLVDLTVICLSYLAAFLLRFEGALSPQNLELILRSLPVLIGIKLLSFFSFGLYRGVWRYVSLNDVVSIFKAVVVGQVVSILFLLYLFRFQGYSRTVFINDGLLLLVLVASSRAVLRLFREFFMSLGDKGKRILIMGAGDGGEMALREIRNNRRLDYRTIGFIDDDVRKRGHLIHGIPVLGTRRDLINISKKRRVHGVLIAIPSLPDVGLTDVYEACREHNILCWRMPFVIGVPEDGNKEKRGFS